MAEPVLIRGHMTSGLTWARILIPLGFAISIVLLVTSSRPDEFVISMTLIMVSLLAWISVEAYASRRRSSRIWVRDTETGFEIITRAGRASVPDRSVTSLAMTVRHNQVRGVLQSITRRFTVWSDQLPQLILFETTLHEHQPDPLDALVSRLWQQVVDQTLGQIRAGQPLVGEGWRLSRDTFTWGAPDGQQTLTRQEIDTCEMLDGQMCIWIRDEEDAIAKLPVDGRDVCLLPQLLFPEIHPNARPKEGFSPVLGRTLFELRPNSTTRLLGYIGGSFLVITGILLQLNREGIGATFCWAGALWAIWAYWKGFAVFRCQELGIHTASMWRSRAMRYADTTAFSCSTTRHYINGIYSGTRVVMEFVAMARLKSWRIHYSEKVPVEDSTLTEIRQIISQPIAARMETRLADGKTVTWTPNLKLAPEGIHYRPKTLLGRAEMQLLPREEYGGCATKLGVFYLFHTGQTKPIISEPVSALNFFPGYLLFLKLYETGRV